MIINFYQRLRYEFPQLTIGICQRVSLTILGSLKGFKALKNYIHIPSEGDVQRGKYLTEGRYIFAGVNFDLDIENPWLIEIPSPEVEENLHGFCWLNDLAVLGNTKARNLAMHWMKRWDLYYSLGKKKEWEPYITASRSINILKNLRFLDGGAPMDRRGSAKLLWRQYKYLSFMVLVYPPGLKKVKVLFSIFLLAAAFGLSNRVQRKILKRLIRSVLVSFSVNGEMAGRSPEDFFEYFMIVIEILKFHETKNLLTNDNLESLQILKKAMAPVVRGLRLGDGSLTRTHGGDTGCAGLIDRYLVNSNVKSGPAFTDILGFERINAGRLILIVDAAKPYQGLDSHNPHLSCLSFELSSGQRPIFVNCGPGGRFGTAFRRYCRSTQAHNSCTLGDLSQAQFEFISRQKRWPKEILTQGPKNVLVSREKTLEATWLNLSHDSYFDKYGFIHYRRLFVLNSGKVFTGTDIFETSKLRKQTDKRIDHFYAHFQLHPDVELWDHPRLQTIILRLKNGEHWIFESDLGTVTIEESTYINSIISKPQSTKRIVIKSSTLLNKTEIKWSLRRREIVTRNTRDLNIVS